jgi:hypothetical protein
MHLKRGVTLTILGIANGVWVLAIGGAETWFRLKDKTILPFVLWIFRTGWKHSLLLAGFLTALSLFGGLNWIQSIAIGLGSGLIVPLLGSLSGALFRRMIDRGLM